MPKVFLGTSIEDRKEFTKLMKTFMKANKATGDYTIDKIEAWIEDFAQKCFEMGGDSIKYASEYEQK